MILKKYNQILKKNHDILRRDIYELKSSHIFQHVGEHNNRLNKVNKELNDLKEALEKHLKRIQQYEGSENATEMIQMDDLKATIKYLSKRIE